MRWSVLLAVVVRAAVLLPATSPFLTPATAEDWPMFGRNWARNAVSPEANPPISWQVERRDKAGNVTQPGQNIKWQADLGSTTFGDPVVADGLVWVGTNNTRWSADQDASVLACFRESDGKLLYRYVSPRLPYGRVHDWPYSAMACSPLIEGDRLWFTSNRGEVVCLDVGPLKRGEPQPREVWKLDMMKQLGVRPCGSQMALCHLCSIASYRDLIYVITGNGAGDTDLRLDAPEAPSVICVRKNDGKVMWQDNSPGANIIIGQWSSPLVIETANPAQVVVPQGDGWLRSFDAFTGKLIWKFDINFKTSHLELGGRGTRNDILATPVYEGGRVYVASGQYAVNGEGPARLVCVDPTKTGDISSELAVDAAGQPVPPNRIQAVDPGKGQRAIPNPNSGLVWDYVSADRNGDGKIEFDEQLHRTQVNVAIKDGVLVAADGSGLVHCLDAKTGKIHWTFDCLAPIYSTQLIVGNRVYVADEDGDVAVFGLSADPEIAMPNGMPLAEIDMVQSIYCSPIFANGTLYVATRDKLFAIATDPPVEKQVAAAGADWPMYGRDATHNAVSPETNPPTRWEVGKFERNTGVWRGETSRNIKWQAPLGNQTFGDPVVAGGLIWIGTNNGYGDNVVDASVLTCLRESDGKVLYRYVSPRLPGGRVHDWPLAAMNCSPLIEGDRMWFTTNRCEAVCMDIGPLRRGEPQPREVWRLDMIKQLGVFPRAPSMGLAHLCSIAAYRDLIYVVTGNGVDEHSTSIPAPEAPSLICLKKESGEVVWKDNSPGAHILTGQWSSPLVIDQGGRVQVVVPQGDGWIRSFEPLTGKLIWKFDINFKTSRLELGGRGTKNDCSATLVLYDGKIYVASGQQAEHGEGDGRLVCIDPNKTGDISSELAVDRDGNPLPDNRIQAVDSAQGQRAIPNPNSGLVWECVKSDRNGNGKIDFEEGFYRTHSNVAIKSDLLFVTDGSGLTHCLDAQTGKIHWMYDLLAAAFGSPLIVGDKVYIADEDGDVAIFGLSADPQIAFGKGPDPNSQTAINNGKAPLAEINMDNSVYCSPIHAHGTLYVASKDHLFAIQDQGAEAAGYWPQWRGPTRDNISADWDLLQDWPESGPPLKWRTDGIGAGIASVAVAGGTIYTLGTADNQEHVVALNEATGELRWKAAIGPVFPEQPLMRWLSQRTPTVDGERLYVSQAQGNLVCLQEADGKVLWRKNYRQDFGSPGRTWGFVDRPLVDGDNLICTPGGPEATLVALNKHTGEVVWKCLVDGEVTGAYGALIAADIAGARQYIVHLSACLVGVRASDGKLLWRHKGHGKTTANSYTPIVADNAVISPNGYGSGVLVLKLSAKGGEFRVQEQQFTRLSLDAFQDSSVRIGDHLFLSPLSGGLVCLNWRTGGNAWGPQRTDGKGKVAMTYADGRLYLLYSDGTFLLAESMPAAYRPHGRFSLPDHEPSIGATFPVITRGRIYVRDNDHLFCYDIRAKGDENSAAPRLTKLDITQSSTPPATTDRSQAKNKQPDAIFVPTPHDVVAKMLELAGVKKTDVVYDLGSGDGRIVIAAAKTYGAKAIGIELDKRLAEESQSNAEKAGVSELVRIEYADIFKRDLGEADVIALYLPPNLMDRLLPQLEKVKPGTRIVSHFFKFTDIPPGKSLRLDSKDDGDTHEIYLWTTPLRKLK